MCVACRGTMPDSDAFFELECRAKELRESFSGMSAGPTAEFMARLRELDEFRWTSGAEWGHPKTRDACFSHIFGRPDERGGPERGLALFLMACWLDRQKPYESVWSRGLESLDAWLGPHETSEDAWSRGLKYLDAWLAMEGLGDPPGLPEDKEHIRYTVQRGMRGHSGGIPGWFRSVIRHLAGRRDPNIEKRNTYGFLGHLMGMFLDLGENAVMDVLRLCEGGIVLIPYRRAWTALMSLRRDRSLVRCLLTRALHALPDGQEVLRLWYDDDMFPPTQCQLPVDGRVKEGFQRLFPGSARNEAELMRRAKEFADREHISPSSFDVLFFGYKRKRRQRPCTHDTASG